jgi:hypothetical protein
MAAVQLQYCLHDVSVSSFVGSLHLSLHQVSVSSFVHDLYGGTPWHANIFVAPVVGVVVVRVVFFFQVVVVIERIVVLDRLVHDVVVVGHDRRCLRRRLLQPCPATCFAASFVERLCCINMTREVAVVAPLRKACEATAPSIVRLASFRINFGMFALGAAMVTASGFFWKEGTSCT